MPAPEEVVVDGGAPAGPKYSILRQRVDLDVDFPTQTLKGATEITVQPHVQDLKEIRLHSRQCRVTGIQANGITAKFEYEDPYRNAHLVGDTNVHQHQMLKSRIQKALAPAPQPELAITLPAKLKIQELHLDPVTQLPQYGGKPSLEKQETDALAVVETPTATAAQAQFAPIKLFIEFEVNNFRDGLHWIGCDDHDKRYPYVYTKVEPWSGNTSCIFPCIDDATSRCSWEFSVHCPRTLGDAFRKEKPVQPTPAEQQQDQPARQKDGDVEMVNGTNDASKQASKESLIPPEYIIDLSEDDAAIDLAIVCVGDQVDDVVDSEDETWHTVTFSLTEPVTARHVGFAIGPFERIDLSYTRDAGEEERLGQSAIKAEAFCLPGRGDEVRNTCFPLTRAIDHFGVTYGSYPFNNYQVLFLDDFVHDTAATAGVSFCSSRLLFPEDIIEPMEKNTRILIRAIADHWAGVSVIPKGTSDAWAVAGIAGYMSDLYGKVLFGNNIYRWEQKLAAEKVYEQDVDRPSIQQHGPLLHIDPSIREFMDLKSALVLFILDRRLVKTSGSSGCQRIINRIFLQSKTGTLENGELSTAEFQRICERFSHGKLDTFFKQWVFGSGCPIFYVTQKFNKKKLVVEMTISQRQLERKTKPPFAPNNFMREIKEYVQEVWAPEIQPIFTGPMTIRIHEADGTPYEHIVEIKEQTQKLEIPYNTKYKRLKRSRRQKERAMAEGQTGESGEDALLYCLGDILDSPEEVKEWNLLDWTTEDEEKMGQESYEWIRMDADFEWIGKMHLVMPLYMYISQLQQDRDVVAQYESMKWLMGTNPHHISLSIMLRTLMDSRYFYGIRTMAADGLAMLATRSLEPPNQDIFEIGKFHLEKAFQELFCFPGEVMPKPNDFSDRRNYIIQSAIPKAMAQLRDHEKKVPMAIRRFFVDKLKFNDNSENQYSDCHYVATLMSCLADSLVVSHRKIQPTYTFSFGDEDEPEEPENPDEPFEWEAIDEIERYRRIDEWVTTYQNTYSITALECLQKLTKGGLLMDKAKEVLQYTRPTNADLVRLQAFKCLAETGLTRRMTVMKYLLHSIVEDTSPFFRSRLLAIFGEALGHIALGDAETEKPAQPAPPQDNDGLVLEQEATSEERHLEATRKTTPEGAIAALKLALDNEAVFKEALWYATTSPDITLDEVAAFCDVAALLYRPIASCRVTTKLPKMWNVKHLGNAKMQFSSRPPYRTKPVTPLSLEDWQEMQSLGLKYTGPKEPEPLPQRRQSSIDDDTPLAQVRQLPPPTFSAAPPVVGTPTQEGGFKLKLGAGTKRKSSVDISASQRAGSPKAQKLLSRQQTPSSFAQSPPPPTVKRSPSVGSQRRGSTSGAKAGGKKGVVNSKIVKLRLSKAGSETAEQILASPQRPGGVKPLPGDRRESMRSITPVVPPQQQQPQSSLFSSTMLQSPTGNNFFSASPLQTQPMPMNLGGFRSYGPAPDAGGAASASPEVAQDSLKQEGLQPLFSPTNSAVSGLAPLSLSPPAAAAPADNQAMPPPPKPKLKLKVRNPSVSGSGSGSGSPAPAP
jgi:transcription initiation factor TFIID subunit 2